LPVFVWLVVVYKIINLLHLCKLEHFTVRMCICYANIPHGHFIANDRLSDVYLQL